MLTRSVVAIADGARIRRDMYEYVVQYMLGIVSSLRALLRCYGNRAVTFTKIKGLFTKIAKSQIILFLNQDMKFDQIK